MRVVNAFPWIWKRYGRSFGTWRVAQLVATATPTWRKVRILASDGSPIWLDLRDPGCFHLLVNGVTEEAERVVVAPYIRADSVSIDIGANIGTWARELAAMSPAGKVYALEPASHTYALLERNAAEVSNVVPHRLALADEPGVMHLAYAMSSGVRFLSNEGEPVTVETLDNFVEGEKVSRVDFIKLDVEGAEMKVLKGAEETLRKHRPVVVFEHIRSIAERGGYTKEDVVAFFEDRGYLVHQIVKPGELIDTWAHAPERFTSNFLAVPRSS